MKFASGLPETSCGLGSTFRATEDVREWLPAALDCTKGRVLLDAPCGDCNWIGRVDLGGMRYVGVDSDPDHVALAQIRAPGNVILADIVADDLPRADVILSRDFLQHLPNALAIRAIDNFRKTGAGWILATDFVGGRNDEIAKAGGFRRVDMRAEPFNWREAVMFCEDPKGSGRLLSLYRL